MIIFPLSTGGKIVLILIAIVLGIIYFALANPDTFRGYVRKLTGKRDILKEKKEDDM